MKILKWLIPSLIVLSAMVLSVFLTNVLEIQDVGLSFLVGMACGCPGGVLAFLVWEYFDEKIEGW